MSKTTTRKLAVGVSGRSWLLNGFCAEITKRYGKHIDLFDKTSHFISARNRELKMVADGRADPRTAVRNIRMQRVDVMVHFSDNPNLPRGEHVALVTVKGPRRKRSLTLRFDPHAKNCYLQPTGEIVQAINHVMR